MKDKVIALTGAASGIGLSTCHILASRGAILSIADNRAEPLAKAAAALRDAGAKVLSAVVDTRNKNEVEAWIQSTVKEFGRLDGAANLAGVIVSPWYPHVEMVLENLVSTSCSVMLYPIGSTRKIELRKEHHRETISPATQFHCLQRLRPSPPSTSAVPDPALTVPSPGPQHGKARHCRIHQRR